MDGGVSHRAGRVCSSGCGGRGLPRTRPGGFVAGYGQLVARFVVVAGANGRVVEEGLPPCEVTIDLPWRTTGRRIMSQHQSASPDQAVGEPWVTTARQRFAAAAVDDGGQDDH